MRLTGITRAPLGASSGSKKLHVMDAVVCACDGVCNKRKLTSFSALWDLRTSLPARTLSCHSNWHGRSRTPLACTEGRLRLDPPAFGCDVRVSDSSRYLGGSSAGATHIVVVVLAGSRGCVVVRVHSSGLGGHSDAAGGISAVVQRLPSDGVAFGSGALGTGGREVCVEAEPDTSRAVVRGTKGRFRGGGPALHARDLIAGICLSLVGDKQQVEDLMKQDWVNTWQGWEEVSEDCSDGAAMAVAKRFLNIAKANVPAEAILDQQRLKELRGQGLYLRLASSHGVNNCLIDSLLLNLMAADVAPVQYTLEQRAALCAACREDLVNQYDVAHGVYLDGHRDTPRILEFFLRKTWGKEIAVRVCFYDRLHSEDLGKVGHELSYLEYAPGEKLIYDQHTFHVYNHTDPAGNGYHFDALVNAPQTNRGVGDKMQDASAGDATRSSQKKDAGTGNKMLRTAAEDVACNSQECHAGTTRKRQPADNGIPGFAVGTPPPSKAGNSPEGQTGMGGKTVATEGKAETTGKREHADDRIPGLAEKGPLPKKARRGKASVEHAAPCLPAQPNMAQGGLGIPAGTPRRRLRGKQPPPITFAEQAGGNSHTPDVTDTVWEMQSDEYILDLWSATAGNVDPRAKADEVLKALGHQYRSQPTLPEWLVSKERLPYDIAPICCGFQNCHFETTTPEKLNSHIATEHKETLSSVAKWFPATWPGDERYMEAYRAGLTWACQQRAPVAHPALDRRAVRLYRDNQRGDKIGAALCFLCAQRFPYTNSMGPGDGIRWNKIVGPGDNEILSLSFQEAKRCLSRAAYLDVYVSQHDIDTQMKLETDLQDWCVQVRWGTGSMDIIAWRVPPQTKLAQTVARPSVRSVGSKCEKQKLFPRNLWQTT